jgi:hypothetical protein
VVRVHARPVAVAQVVDGVVVAVQGAVRVRHVPHVAVSDGRAATQLELGVAGGIEGTSPHPASAVADGDVGADGPCQIIGGHDEMLAVKVAVGVCPRSETIEVSTRARMMVGKARLRTK